MAIFWIILGIVSVILLIVFWRNKNAVWGGLTLGFIVGLIIALTYLFKGNGFSYMILIKGAILGVIAGSIAELLGLVGKK